MRDADVSGRSEGGVTPPLVWGDGGFRAESPAGAEELAGTEEFAGTEDIVGAMAIASVGINI